MNYGYIHILNSELWICTYPLVMNYGYVRIYIDMYKNIQIIFLIKLSTKVNKATFNI